MELPSDWETDTVEANGVDLRYYRTGEGPPIVYAHGFYGNGRSRRRLIDDLASTHTVVSYDARGHGRSAAPETGYTVDDRAADLLGLLDALALSEPVLMGHSMGGATVAAAAAEAPERVSGAVLVDPAGFTGEPAPMGPDERAAFVREQVAEWADRGVDAIAEENAEELPDEYLDAAPGQPRREAEAAVECSPVIAEIAREGYPEEAYVAELFPRIDAPALVLRADAEPERRREDLDAADALPNGRLVHVPDADHAVFQSRYDAAVRELRAFLRGCQSQSTNTA
jgi:pimeloyl-ACP methyl ester carboxylesterase